MLGKLGVLHVRPRRESLPGQLGASNQKTGTHSAPSSKIPGATYEYPTSRLRSSVEPSDVKRRPSKPIVLREIYAVSSGSAASASTSGYSCTEVIQSMWNCYGYIASATFYFLGKYGWASGQVGEINSFGPASGASGQYQPMCGAGARNAT